MTDTFVVTPDVAPELPKTSLHAKGCAHCGRPFGLVRQRLATKHLCSKACLAAESQRMQFALREKVRRIAQIARGD